MSSVLQNFFAGAQAGRGMRQAQGRQAASKLAMMGDYKGAQAKSMEYGDTQGAQDYQAIMQSANEQERSAMAQRASDFADIAFSAKNLPIEQRQNYVASQLSIRGYNPEELLPLVPGWDDANMTAIGQQSMTVKDQLGQFETKTAIVNDQIIGTRVNNLTGQMTAAPLITADPAYTDITGRQAQEEAARANVEGERLEAQRLAETRRSNIAGEGIKRQDNALRQQQIQMNQAGASGPDIKAESDLRDEFEGRQKEFFKVRDAYGRVKTAAANPSPAGDMALIFNFMKMLDPGSTVREGEFASAQNATGVPERVRNTYNRAISGEMLNDNQRQDFVSQSEGLYQSQAQFYEQDAARYTELANAYGLEPSRIVQPLPQFKDRLKKPTPLDDTGLPPNMRTSPDGVIEWSFD